MDNFNNNQDIFSYTITLKIIFILSLTFVALDVFQIISTFSSISRYASILPPDIFDKCLRYQYINELGFSIFGIFSGLSAGILSMGMICDVDYFTNQIFDSFLQFNYLIFGPYLFAGCVLGFYYFDNIAYVCDEKNPNIKYVNFSTVISILFCLSMSAIITLIFSSVMSVEKLTKSIRFVDGGNRIIGKVFWYFVLNRNNNNNNSNNSGNNNNNNLLSNSNSNNSVEYHNSNNNNLILSENHELLN